ncbi:MAG: hypothetical protein ACLR76_12210 [Alistipes sp.]
MGNIPWDTIYRIAQDQYAKGINMLIPHAVWYDDRNVTFLPELSHRNPLYRDGLYEFNTFLGRLNVLLQNDARLATDIAVLYPIETMQAGHRFDGPLTAYEGGVRVPDMDYVQVGCRLTDRLGRDFIYLHPEVLASERTSVAKRRLLLEGERQPQSLRTLVVPSSEVVSAEGLAKIEAFFDAGGQVIFTTRLPARSSEPGHDAEVTERIGRMLPETSRQPDGSIVRRNRREARPASFPRRRPKRWPRRWKYPARLRTSASPPEPSRFAACTRCSTEGTFTIWPTCRTRFSTRPSRCAGKNGSRYGTRIRARSPRPIPSPAARAGTARRKSGCVSNRIVRCF